MNLVANNNPLSSDGPIFWFTAQKRDLICQQAYRRLGKEDIIRLVRGQKMRNLPALIDEFAAVFQLSEVIGHNWHALEETLCYLDEVRQADGYLVVVGRAEEMLQSMPDQIEWFYKVLQDVGNWWSKPINDNPPYNRPAIPFRCILEGPKEWVDRMMGELKSWDIAAQIL